MTVLVPVSPSGLVIAMLTSLLFIVLLRFLAGIMVWVMIVMVILVIGYGKPRPDPTRVGSVTQTWVSFELLGY